MDGTSFSTLPSKSSALLVLQHRGAKPPKNYVYAVTEAATIHRAGQGNPSQMFFTGISTGTSKTTHRAGKY